eukprot:scaffold72395_cov23-Cyclotella_meneghiniana.AAC.1
MTGKGGRPGIAQNHVAPSPEPTNGLLIACVIRLSTGHCPLSPPTVVIVQVILHTTSPSQITNSITRALSQEWCVY